MIKNLMFDLGGVIMDIERMRCVRAFEELGLRNADSYLGDYEQQGPFAALESGKIGAYEFRRRMRALIGREVSDADIDGALIRFLIGIPLHRLEELRRLRERYGMYLLSNTNPIMWNSFIAESFRQEGKEIGDYFDGMVTSFEAKMMKPAPAIFDYAREKFGIRPEETMFLDDSEANCEAAISLGWRALHVAPGTEFMEALHRENLV